MESPQQLKQRIGGIQNIHQITKAMEMVAATKMRKSQELALAARPYAFTALEILANLSAALARDEHMQERVPLLQHRRGGATAVVVVTSDKGLAGAFNTTVLRKVDNFLKTHEVARHPQRYPCIAIGQKAHQFLQKKHLQVVAHFTRVGDFTTIHEVRPISDLLIKGFLEQQWNKVIIFSMHFQSALRQEVAMRTLFPVSFAAIKKLVEEIVPRQGKFSEFFTNAPSSLTKTEAQAVAREYLIEPSAEEVLNDLIPHLITMQLYHLILEANASEHSARRMAMKNASDNAEDLVGKLTLVYNKSRQAAITKEIIEVTSGSESLASQS
ncbi:ATP synthase F1 subunit gamma [Candidatus Parcubacteria bacterium]|nr:MAG: ATP synthase F1 subunit gamma [Candidatus Parcubacteria bacterium]